MAGSWRTGSDESLACVNWLRHATAPLILRKVASALEAEAIPWLPVKGIVTAYTLYDDVAERPISDIDLRIARRHFSRVVRMARARGWTPDTASAVLWGAVLKVDGWEVDIKCSLGPPGLCAVSVEEVLGRAERRVEPFGWPHLRPEINDHALMLVLNAFKDGLRPTPWAVEDLRRITQHDRFDASILVSRARQGRVATVLWIVADWLAEEHGEPAWRLVRERVGPQPPSRRVAWLHITLQRRGWTSRSGLVATAAASDDLLRCASGLTLFASGVLRRHVWLRALGEVRR